jgi:hypothetical protein
MSSDFLGSIECVPQMVIFDVMSQDLNILKQSAIQGNTGVWQSNFPRSATPLPWLLQWRTDS